MITSYQSLPADVVCNLLQEVVDAPLLPTNQLVVAQEGVVERIRQRMAEHLGKDIVFFKAFLFLLSKTTYAGVVADNGEGWHNDASCDEVDGDCFNVWIPLYCSDSRSGLRVAAREENEWLYSKLPVPRARVEVLTRLRCPELFKAGEDDALVVDVKNSAGFSFSMRSLKVRETLGVSVGDVVIFDQSELHQGLHGDGVRIQLTLKFRAADSTARSVVFPEAPIALSKHGILERQLIQELLEMQLASICLHGAPLPVRSARAD